jgi:hypothetical protein
LGAFLMLAVAAQQQVRDKAEGGAHRAEIAQREAEEAQRRAQAVDILKGVVESAADIQETLRCESSIGSRSDCAATSF